MNHDFTDKVRKALALAREEAIALQHRDITPEHILLGILRHPHNAGAAVLESLRVSLAELRSRIEVDLEPGTTPWSASGEFEFTVPAKRTLEFAVAEARDLRHDYVGTEHLLLGILRLGKGTATRALVSVGLTLNNARERVQTLSAVLRG